MEKKGQYKNPNQQTRGGFQAVCYEFQEKGRCRWGSGCRFSHSAVKKEDHSVNVQMPEVNKRVQVIRLNLHSGREDILGNESSPPSQVRLTAVQAQLCKFYKVGSIKHLIAVVENGNSSCRRKLDINLIDELQVVRRLEDKIDTYIRAYLFSRKICTLHSLDKDIAADFSHEKKILERYADLQMGPLVCHRMVREKFKIHGPSMVIPDISENFFYTEFWIWINRQGKKRRVKEKKELNDFLGFLALKMGVKSPEDLG
eukprot:CAMPEP_0171327456 /NCGR_PEP_ID=MMETSP0816-20121228/118101_1 /TAXON_ID=420281 /ORGANISM="Proboscia inermis, Strain CCAP1064/1" /LENGTH=256 /DNA_ID=CAMNT_0011827201 /DNA_START=490 /DNA_END=1256 /DNA_ORIENTATION=+